MLKTSWHLCIIHKNKTLLIWAIWVNRASTLPGLRKKEILKNGRYRAESGKHWVP